MKILISGATGFVGRHACRHLAAQHQVYALTRTSTDTPPTDSVTWIRQDLSAAIKVHALPDHLDAIVHLAQSRHYRHFPDKASDIYDVNVASTIGLLEYAKNAGVSHFVYTSTGGIYEPAPHAVTENDTPNPVRPGHPLSFYFSTKYAAELLVRNYARLFQTAILRPFFVYGPGQQGMLISNLMAKVRNGETVAIQGNPGIRINPIHVSDMVQAIQMLLESRTGGLFNLAGKETVALSELVAMIGSALNCPPKVQHTASNDSADLVADTTRICAATGFAPRTSLFEGLRQLA